MLLLVALSEAQGPVHPVDRYTKTAYGSATPVAFIAADAPLAAEGVTYYARTPGGIVFVTDTGQIGYLLTVLANPPAPSTPSYLREGPTEERGGLVVIRETISGQIETVSGRDLLPTTVSLFKGSDPSSWRRDIPTYGAVRLGILPEGIETTVRMRGYNMEKVFTVMPGGDPGAIKIRVDGGNDLRLNDDGELLLLTALGPVRFTKPEAFQEIGGNRISVPAAYTVDGSSHTYGFVVGDYDRRYPLTIDPLLASTFLGGSAGDGAWSVAVDDEGSVYIAGSTQSSNFPTSPGAYDRSNKCYDAFVSKFSGDLSTLLASTFLGPVSCQHFSVTVSDLVTDGRGNVYVAGQTAEPGFPVTSGAVRKVCEAYWGPLYCSDGFISKLSGDLTKLLASTFIGGLDHDGVGGLVVDGDGHVFATGITYSDDLVTTAGAYQRVKRPCGDHAVGSSCSDAFVMALNSDLSEYITATYLGGTNWDRGAALTLDPSGRVYVKGYTNSADFPVPPSAWQPILTEGVCLDPLIGFVTCSDTFVARLSHDLSRLEAATLIGGSGEELSYDSHSLGLDSTGNVIITGGTMSADFPTTDGTVGPLFHGEGEGYIATFDGDLSRLVASTYIGGEGPDFAFSLALDGEDNIFVAGYTYSPDFPTTPGAYNPFLPVGASAYAFVSKVNPALSEILASTVIGGFFPSGTFGRSLALDKTGNVYVAGDTWAADFPTTKKAYQRTLVSHDAFVAKFDSRLSAGQVLTVMKEGNGFGTVVPDSGSLSWQGNAGTEVYETGKMVALSPVPSPGSRFAGWRGSVCSGTGDCTLVMSEETDVGASFTRPVLDVAATSGGTVTSVPAGIVCPSVCAAAYDLGTQVVLSANPLPGSVFAGWSGGGCNGTGPCVIHMTDDAGVRAQFFACSYSVSPTAKAFPAGPTGLTATFRISASGSKACPAPVPSADARWLSSVVQGWTGSKGVMKVVVDENGSVFPRAGSVLIGGDAVAINQAGAACRVLSIVPSSQVFSHKGGEGIFVITTSTDDCPWEATSPAAWITVRSPTGRGSGAVAYRVEAGGKPSAQRSSTINVVPQGCPARKKAHQVRQSR
jgi:hypothetical protein